MSLVLFYSDCHLRSSGSFPPFNRVVESGMTKELENIIEGFRFVASQIVKLRPKVVVNCGDTFHNTEFISSMTMYGASIALDTIAKACREVNAHHIITSGNHDILIQDSSKVISSISLLEGFGEICVFPKKFIFDDFTFGLVPYNSDHEQAYLDLVSFQKDCDFLVTHLDFCGCRYDSGRESESSLDPNFDVPVVSGDIHSPQQIGSVTYVGSLIQHKFNHWDLKNTGGVLTLETESKKIKRIPNTFSKHYVKIDLDSLKGEKIPFSPEKVVLQAFSEKSEEEFKDLLDGFDFFFVRKFSEKIISKSFDEQMNSESPTNLFKNFVKANNPSAMDDLNEVLK